MYQGQSKYQQMKEAIREKRGRGEPVSPAEMKAANQQKTREAMQMMIAQKKKAKEAAEGGGKGGGKGGGGGKGKGGKGAGQQRNPSSFKEKAKMATWKRQQEEKEEALVAAQRKRVTDERAEEVEEKVELEHDELFMFAIFAIAAVWMISQAIAASGGASVVALKW
jgi:hypothetical protein